MKRREFCASVVASASLGRTRMVEPGRQNPAGFPNVPGLTKYVSEFIVNAKYEDIPENVLALGRKSILDGFGLALAGSVSEMGPLVRDYVSRFANAPGRASVVGSELKVPARFAALANGIFIHADDYDDTQLSVAPDRIYGLLTHPTVSTLPPAFALAEVRRYTGKELT